MSRRKSSSIIDRARCAPPRSKLNPNRARHSSRELVIVTMFRPFVPCLTGPNPIVDLFPPKLPETANLVGWHALSINPFVNRVPLDPELGRNLFHGKPAIFGRAVHLRFLAWFRRTTENALWLVRICPIHPSRCRCIIILRMLSENRATGSRKVHRDKLPAEPVQSLRAGKSSLIPRSGILSECLAATFNSGISGWT